MPELEISWASEEREELGEEEKEQKEEPEAEKEKDPADEREEEPQEQEEKEPEEEDELLLCKEPESSNATLIDHIMVKLLQSEIGLNGSVRKRLGPG
jgi:hypothetical protein